MVICNLSITSKKELSVLINPKPNPEEGIIILHDDTEKIKLVNTAARKMLNLPVPEANAFEERL